MKQDKNIEIDSTKIQDYLIKSIFENKYSRQELGVFAKFFKQVNIVKRHKDFKANLPIQDNLHLFNLTDTENHTINKFFNDIEVYYNG